MLWVGQLLLRKTDSCCGNFPLQLPLSAYRDYPYFSRLLKWYTAGFVGSC